MIYVLTNALETSNHIYTHREVSKMSRNRVPQYLLTFVIFIAVAVTGVVALASSSEQAAAQVIQMEIAEDGARFIFDEAPVYDDGMPAHGNSFVTFGYIYPAGTLNGSNGVLENGEPEFPELVLGEWYCRGYMIGEAAHAETGEWVISTQTFKFNEDVYSGAILVTEGFEIADFNVPVTRAITGGTGQFRSARGEGTQQLLGFTDAMGVNLSVELSVEAD
jgi:hypothetical protein